MHHASLREDALIALDDGLFGCRKPRDHILSQLRHLHRQGVYAGRELLKTCHVVFQLFYSALNSLRWHRGLHPERTSLDRVRSWRLYHCD